MMLGVSSTRPGSDRSSPEIRAAGHLRNLVAAVRPEELLRRCVPAFRDGIWIPRDARFESYPWKGAVAVEGTVSMESDASGASRPNSPGRFSFRVTPFDVASADGTEAEREPDPFVGYDEDHAVEVRVSPADPDLPGLAEALGGRSAIGPLRDVTLLGHRFGRRAALRARTGAGDAVIVKLFSRKRADRVAAALTQVADVSAARMPQVLGVAQDRRSLVLEFLPGRILHDHWNRIAPADLEGVGAAVRRLAEEATLPSATWAVMDELSTILRFTERLRFFDRPFADEVQRRADLVPRQACGSTPVRIHRDLHDRQIVLGEGVPGIVDWDLAAAGVPEIDAMNFVAHLSLRAMQGRLDPERVPSLRTAFLVGYLGDDARTDALLLWERVALLRLACVYALRPPQPGIAARLLQLYDEVEATE